MTKTKIKLLRLTPFEQRDFENFLNHYAAQGWHPVSFTIFYIRFAYQPEKKVQYCVILDESKLTFAFHQTKQRQIKLQQFIEDFGYRRVLSSTNYIIYESATGQELYTDESVDKEQRTQAAKRYIIYTLVISGLYMLTALLFMQNFNNFLLRGLNQFMTVFYSGFSLVNLSSIYSAIRYKNGSYTTRSHKWKSLHTDPFSLINCGLFFIAVILLILYLVYSSSFAPVLLLVLVSGLTFLIIGMGYIIIRNNIKSKILSLLLVVVLVFGSFQLMTLWKATSIYVGLLKNDHNQLIDPAINFKTLDTIVSTESNCNAYNEFGLFSNQSDLVCYSEEESDQNIYISIIRIRFSAMVPMMEKAFIEREFISYNSSLEEDKETMLTRFYGNNEVKIYYAYRHEDVILLSTKPISQELIEDIRANRISE